MTWRWYITIRAISDYMLLAGLRGPLEQANPAFVEAQNVLGDLSLTAQLARTPEGMSGALTYRGKVTLRGKRRRVDLTVIPFVRAEGDLPQLVRVRLK